MHFRVSAPALPGRLAVVRDGGELRWGADRHIHSPTLRRSRPCRECENVVGHGQVHTGHYLRSGAPGTDLHRLRERKGGEARWVPSIRIRASGPSPVSTCGCQISL